MAGTQGSSAIRPAHDIDLILARHRKTIRDLPKGEAHKHVGRRTIAAIESEISDLLRLEGPVPEALILYANLAIYKRNWPEAIRRWQDVAARSRKHEALAYLKSAIAHRKNGDLHAAGMALRQAESAGIDKVQLKKEKRALGAGGKSWESARLVHQSFEEFKTGGEDDVISLLRSGMRLKGADARTCEFAESVVRKLVRLAKKEEASGGSDVDPVKHGRRPLGGTLEFPESPVPTAQPTVVLTCGFGWSGSGAVTDYLREFAPVSLPFGTAELGCFEQVHGARTVLSTRSPGCLGNELYGFFVAWVLGMSDDLQKAKKVEQRALIRYFDSRHELDGLGAACMDAFEAMHDTYGRANGEECMMRAFRRLFGYVFRAKSDGDKLIILNNAIHGHRIDLTQLIPNAKSIVVVRDPRDQFVSRLIESGKKTIASEFISSTRKRLRSCRKALKNPEIRRCVEVVRFEEFVASAEVRRAVLGRLDLTEADRNGERFFFPEDSQRNVGIHRAHSNQKEIAHIHEELAPYLPEPTLRG